MAEQPQKQSIPDANHSNNNNNKTCCNGSFNKSEKSKTFSNGDVIKRASFYANNENEAEKSARSTSKRGSVHGDAISRTGSRDALLDDEAISRPSIRGSSSDDLLSKTVQGLSRMSMQKSQSLSEEALKGKRNGGTESRKADVHGFVLVSWKIRQFSQLEKALRPGKYLIRFGLYHLKIKVD